MAEQDIRTVHLIVNPRSGYGGQRQLLADLSVALRDADLQVVEYTTRAPQDATRYARTINTPNTAVMVLGGDGTVHEVAGGLAGTDVPILPCPAGTENLLAKELRIPGDPHQMVRVLRTGRVVDCDVGVINGQNFLLIIGIGFDGEVVRRLAAVRTGHISHLSYFWPLWRTFWEHDFPRMRITVEQETVFDDFGLAFVGNISRYAVGLRICRDARYDDGLLDLVVFSCREQTALMLHAAWTLLRLHPLRGDVIYRRVRSVRIETDGPVPSQVDGDAGPNTPLDISVAPWRVKLLIPPRRPSWKVWPWKGDDFV
ncbi:MAG TPA: diacylglycerol kinase family protein [Phycisphaerae bacterium]|nr:diacylglycerol kinase family protein [Phycisphaerae bacterium]HUT57903.1 diacylglycerol kinase family protein [Phycisphaerae bacterium]